ncbi:hypothetical protein AAG747_22630 [Rapidithrix thailandica]|uniref:Uncharacterized protein n=1 Tax=Rapidithrix thailandica TaxID=413964 RepID=A0AAW9SCR2_9BACT
MHLDQEKIVSKWKTQTKKALEPCIPVRQRQGEELFQMLDNNKIRERIIQVVSERESFQEAFPKANFMYICETYDYGRFQYYDLTIKLDAGNYMHSFIYHKNQDSLEVMPPSNIKNYPDAEIVNFDSADLLPCDCHVDYFLIDFNTKIALKD